MLLAIMGHGMTGVVGGGAMTGIEMALWDIKGKALGTPVWNLLGGKMRDRICAYRPRRTRRSARRSWWTRGFTALKTGGVADRWTRCATCARPGRRDRPHGRSAWPALADHAPTPSAWGRRWRSTTCSFTRIPVAPENIEALARVAESGRPPHRRGRAPRTIWGVRELIEREIVDVMQPDTGRAGGLLQMKKIAAMAEAHYITFAPHDGSLGPVAEYAGLHLLATLPNFLIMEHLEDDVPQRYEVITPLPEIVGRRTSCARRGPAWAWTSSRRPSPNTPPTAMSPRQTRTRSRCTIARGGDGRAGRGLGPAIE